MKGVCCSSSDRPPPTLTSPRPPSLGGISRATDGTLAVQAPAIPVRSWPPISGVSVLLWRGGQRHGLSNLSSPALNTHNRHQWRKRTRAPLSHLYPLKARGGCITPQCDCERGRVNSSTLAISRRQSKASPAPSGSALDLQSWWATQNPRSHASSAESESGFDPDLIDIDHLTWSPSHSSWTIKFEKHQSKGRKRTNILVTSNYNEGKKKINTESYVTFFILTYYMAWNWHFKNKRNNQFWVCIFCMLEFLLRSVKAKADPPKSTRRETEIKMGITSRVFHRSDPYSRGKIWRGELLPTKR